jgi:hypothetical protein
LQDANGHRGKHHIPSANISPMKSKLLSISVVALLLAGCDTYPSAKNGRHPWSDVAAIQVLPRAAESPARATAMQVSAPVGPRNGTQLAEATALQGFVGFPGAMVRATDDEAGHGQVVLVARQVPAIRNLALDDQP